MHLTAKSRYALKIMMDLAENGVHSCQQRQHIATRQGISIDFMDQIMAKLRARGFIATRRGRSGGVELLRNPEEISLWDIFEAVEDSLYPVRCMDAGCQFEESCISLPVWEDVFFTIRKELSCRTLRDVVTKSALRRSPPKTQVLEIQECR